MVPMREAEATAREFANRFADGSVVDATALLTDEGRAAVVETFPDGFGEESMDAEDTLERLPIGAPRTVRRLARRERRDRE